MLWVVISPPANRSAALTALLRDLDRFQQAVGLVQRLLVFELRLAVRRSDSTPSSRSKTATPPIQSLCRTLVVFSIWPTRMVLLLPGRQ
jgi:hypothetical protein